MQPTLRQVPPSVLRFSTTADLQAELGGADRADIAAGAGADDDDIIGHEKSLGWKRAARLGERREVQDAKRASIMIRPMIEIAQTIVRA